MIYREYGKTGKKVSAIGFGGMRFLKEEYLDGNYEKCAALVKRAFDLGINYFDTAPGYCDDASEKIFGEAFKSMKGSFYTSTKCGLGNAKDADGCRRMLEASLTRLGLDKITFYNMWCIKTLDEYKQFMKKGGLFEGARKAYDEGLIEHLCFTTHMSGEDIAKVASEGIFEGVTLGYNAVNFAYRQQGIKACHAAGMGVVTMNPLGGGIIPQNEDYFSFIKHNTEDSVVVAALKFIISQKEITIALPGHSTIAELEENIKATEHLTMATDAYIADMAKNLNSELNALCTGCAYCEGCPVDIPIPKFLDSYNNEILYHGREGYESPLDRLKFHWGIPADLASKCIKCGKCEKLCTQKLPIIKRLEAIAALADTVGE